MPRYRIHRLKETPRETFRWAAHTGGLAVVKPKDYEASEEIEAANPYAAWKQMMEGERPIGPGDLLETVSEIDTPLPGEIRIAKYIGFEPAHWFVPEPKAAESANAPEPISSTPASAEQAAK